MPEIRLAGDSACGGLLSYGFMSGENIMDCPQGRPLFMRTPESKFTLANFMRSHLYANFATLKVEMDLLFQKEKDSTGTIATPDPKDVDGFNAYAKEFKDAIAIEQMAIEKYSVNQAP